MKNLALAFPIAAVLFAAAGHAQQLVTGTLMVQCPMSDIVLNKPLVDAMLNEPQCRDELRRTVDTVTVTDYSAQLPVAHLAGTFQLHLRLVVEHPTPLTEVQSQKLLEAAVVHLQRRLDAMLFAEPRQQLLVQRAELQQRHRDLMVKRTELQTRLENQKARLDLARQQCTVGEVQAAAADLEVATEQRAHELLERLRAEQTAARDESRQRTATLVSEKASIEAKLQRLSLRLKGVEAGPLPPEKQEELAKLTAEISSHAATLQSLGRALDEANERAHDLMSMASIVLEQLPTNAIALERAKARQESQRKQLAEAKNDLEKAHHERLESARLEADAEQLTIDVAVTKSMLQEVENRFARLQPVHYQVLHCRQ